MMSGFAPTFQRPSCRRQREAYRRGVIRATALASIIIVALGLLSLVAVNKTSEAKLAQAKAWSTSGRMGQRSGPPGIENRPKRWESSAATSRNFETRRLLPSIWWTWKRIELSLLPPPT
jgi:hypothetical protein